MLKKYRFKLNGREVEVEAHPTDVLSKILRSKLGVTSVRGGCGRGDCGVCTVIIDGRAVHSCLTIMAQIENSEIITLEGLMRDGDLSPLQRRFVESGAIQCGFCTPGMILAATALLSVNPNPSIEEIKDYLRGNLCRCTGYKQIIEAVRRAVSK